MIAEVGFLKLREKQFPLGLQKVKSKWPVSPVMSTELGIYSLNFCFSGVLLNFTIAKNPEVEKLQEIFQSSEKANKAQIQKERCLSEKKIVIMVTICFYIDNRLVHSKTLPTDLAQPFH